MKLAASSFFSIFDPVSVGAVTRMVREAPPSILRAALIAACMMKSRILPLKPGNIGQMHEECEIILSDKILFIIFVEI